MGFYKGFAVSPTKKTGHFGWEGLQSPKYLTELLTRRRAGSTFFHRSHLISHYRGYRRWVKKKHVGIAITIIIRIIVVTVGFYGFYEGKG